MFSKDALKKDDLLRCHVVELSGKFEPRLEKIFERSSAKLDYSDLQKIAVILEIARLSKEQLKPRIKYLVDMLIDQNTDSKELKQYINLLKSRDKAPFIEITCGHPEHSQYFAKCDWNFLNEVVAQ